MLSYEFAKKLTDIAVQQMNNAIQFRQPRIDVIKKIEDVYYNKIIPSFDGRINIPVPFLSGQIDTVRSKIDNRPNIEFTPTEEADVKLSRKVSEAFKVDSSANMGAWAYKDRQEKFLALISGRGIARVFSTKVNGKYKSHYEVVDYMDFLCEGTQGHLEMNMFCGQLNFFRTKNALEDGVKSGAYYREGVDAIKVATSKDKQKVYNDAYKNKVNRLRAMNLQPEEYSFVGQDVINLTYWNLEYEGTRYALLFEPDTATPVYGRYLKDEMFQTKTQDNPVWSYVSWAAFDEPFNFWSKGYGDDILPIAEGIKILVNEVLNNTMRQNRPTRAIDPSVFPDPNELLWRMPDQLVLSNPGTDPKAGIYTFETPNITASLNLVQFLDGFVGRKTGVNSESQGASDANVKVGVYYGSLKEAEDRLGLVEKSYNQSYAEKGFRYYLGLCKNMDEKKMIRMIGKNGVNWDYITRDEMRRSSDLDVIVTGGKAEAEMNMARQKEMRDALMQLTGNPKTLERLSPEWIIERTLAMSGYDQEDIRRATESDGGFDEQMDADAAESIQLILEGTMPRLNRGANVHFLKKIYDFDADELDYIKLDKMGRPIGVDKKKKDQSEMLRRYADAHYDIVIQNTVRNAQMQQRLDHKKRVAAGEPDPIVLPDPGMQQQDAMMTADASPDMRPDNTIREMQAQTLSNAQNASADLRT